MTFTLNFYHPHLLLELLLDRDISYIQRLAQMLPYPLVLQMKTPAAAFCLLTLCGHDTHGSEPPFSL